MSMPKEPDPPASKSQWYIASGRIPIQWRLHWVSDDYERCLFLPLWIPILMTVLPTALAWRLDTLARRRAAAGKCVKCGYDLSGLTTGAACPECGVRSRRQQAPEGRQDVATGGATLL